MKRNNNYLLILAILLLVVAAAALWGCEKGESAYTNYTPEDFVSLNNFTLRTNVKPDNVMRYEKKGDSLYYSSTYVTDSYTNTIYYVFENNGSKEYSEGSWKNIDSSDTDKYINSVENACGLIYNKLQPSQFEEIKGKKLAFGVNSEEFFKQAYRQIYQNYFGTDYDEKEFAEDFEQNSASLFGDVNDYVVTLDCSDKNKMVLQIKNSRTGENDVYEYYAINSTKISLPA